MALLVATTSLPAVYRPNGYARTTTAGTPHARAKNWPLEMNQPPKTTHTFEQVNQANHQMHAYYIHGKSLELDIESNHWLKKNTNCAQGHGLITAKMCFS